MNSKPWWKSKTVWVNVLGAAGMILQQQGVVTLVQPEYAALALTGVNLVLRALTKDSISAK